jgi:hypothetical protein
LYRLDLTRRIEERRTQELLEPLYLLSDVALTEAMHRPPGDDPLQFYAPFHDINGLFSPFHHLLVIYAALLHKRSTTSTKSDLMLAVYLEQLIRRIGRHAEEAGLMDEDTADRMNTAIEHLQAFEGLSAVPEMERRQ